jgi:murein hydrolase activator
MTRPLPFPGNAGSGARRPRLRRLLLVAAALLGVLPGALAGQQNLQRDLRDSRARMDSIQAERTRLQREMDQLRTRVRDTSRQLVNIERQREASRAAMQELEYQVLLLTENIQEVNELLAATQQRLRTRNADMQQRLRTIYKRGRLHSVQVLLTSSSFTDLMNRYKYLHLMTMYDRMVIDEVTRLEGQVAQQERELRESLGRVELLREEKAVELAGLQRVEQQRQATLRQMQQQETRTAGRLTELDREQRQLTSAIADLERRRREEEARSAAPARAAAISTRDLGRLQWPVEGNVVYRFGPDQKPGGIVLRHQGIGIGAPAGTPVLAVERGVVEYASAFPGYGPTVIVSHGGGYRTLYLHLRDVAVRVGQEIPAGHVVGTVGGEQTAEGPHIEFQVRVPMSGGSEPVDPLGWLRARAGGRQP